MTPSLAELHPAQNRGFRELYAATRHVVNHYRALGERLGDDALREAAVTARRLLDELQAETRRYELYGYPAAQNVGATAARARSGVGERFLERNQALRVAVLDIQHVVTLLGYLATASRTHGTLDLAAFCERWHDELGPVEARVRATAIAAGERLDEAVQPLHTSPVGRAAHGVQNVVGTVGELFDRAVRRRG